MKESNSHWENLYKDLAQLPKGLGLQDPAFESRLTPRVRKHFGLRPDDNVEHARDIIVKRLKDLVPRSYTSGIRVSAENYALIVYVCLNAAGELKDIDTSGMGLEERRSLFVERQIFSFYLSKKTVQNYLTRAMKYVAHNPHAEPPPRPRLRHRYILALTSAILLIALIIWLSTRSETNTSADTQLDATLTTVMAYDEAHDEVGYDVAFPADKPDKAEQYRSKYGRSPENIDRVFLESIRDGAYALGGTKLVLELRSTGGLEVRVKDIRLSNLACDSVPATDRVTFDRRSHAPAPQVGFQLGEGSSDARKVTYESAAYKLGSAFFDEDLGIRDTPQQLVVAIKAAPYACTFGLAFRYQVPGDGSTREELLRDPSGGVQLLAVTGTK